MENKCFTGRGLSAGIGIGAASIMPDLNFDMDRVKIHPEAVEKELERFSQALDNTRSSTRQLIAHVNNTLFEDLGELFSVQETVLEDNTFTGRVVNEIKEEQLCAESAVMKALKSLEEDFVERTQGAAVQSRAVDILDVGMRILGHLEAPVSHPRLPQGGILVARRVAPSVAVFLDEYEIDGLIVSNTNRSSHIAVVAQALQIPTVGIPSAEFYEEIKAGVLTIVSANQNCVYLEPDETNLQRHKEAKKRFCQFTKEIRKKTCDISLDRLPVKIRGNLGLMEEISLLDEYGGEGAGLVRTEFLFLGQSEELPDEAIQAETYHRMAGFIKPHPVNLRTFDFGGDKQTFKEPPRVEGRGIYRGLYNRQSLTKQLRAMTRAYQKHENIRILLPLVGSVQEVEKVSEIIDDFCQEKDWSRPPLGIMVEVPSVLFSLDKIIPYVDYLSVGTNDLLNYLLGADRFASTRADSVNYPDPVLFNFIEKIVDQGDKGSVPVGLCGEIGANPIFTPVLIGLGLDELSMAPMRIPEVKLVAGNCPLDKALELAREAKNLSTRDELKEWVKETLGPYAQKILHEKDIPRESREFDYYERETTYGRNESGEVF